MLKRLSDSHKKIYFFNTSKKRNEDKNHSTTALVKCDKVFKNVPSKICGRQPLKNLKG